MRKSGLTELDGANVAAEKLHGPWQEPESRGVGQAKPPPGPGERGRRAK
jgi:hypothetical protein